MSGQAGLTLSGRADAIALWLPWALRSVTAFVISSSIKQVFELQLVAGVNRNQSMFYFKKLLLACELIFLPVLKETKTLSSFLSPSVSLDTLQQNLHPAGTCSLRLFLPSDFRKKPKTDSNWTLRSYAHPLANARSMGWNMLIGGVAYSSLGL